MRGCCVTRYFPQVVFMGTAKAKDKVDYEQLGLFRTKVKQCRVADLLVDEKLQELFSELDQDGNGTISKNEVGAFSHNFLRLKASSFLFEWRVVWVVV